MLKRYLKRIRQDRGDAVLVTTILSIPLFGLAIMFSVGLAMSSWQKTTYQDAAQSAAQAAAGKINASGWLDETAIHTFVSEYLVLTGRQSYSNEQIAAGAQATRESAPTTCTTVTVNGVVYNSPYIELYLDRTRSMGISNQSSAMYVSYGGSAPTSASTLNQRTAYRVISGVVYEASSSTMGLGFALAGKEYGGCVTNRIQVSGISFGADEDLNDIGGDASCWSPTTPTDIIDQPMKTLGSIALYSGADASCSIEGYFTSSYFMVTHEYNGFYLMSTGGNSYWVSALSLRPVDTCDTRELESPVTSLPDTQYTITNTSTEIYTAPYNDCGSSAHITMGQTVTVNGRYTSSSGVVYVRLTTGEWVREAFL